MGAAVPALIPVLGSRGRLEAEADRDGKFQNSQVYIETCLKNPQTKKVREYSLYTIKEKLAEIIFIPRFNI